MTRALVLLSLLSGCAPLLRNAEPDGFQRSLAELRAKHTPADPKIGTVPVSLSLIDPSYAAVGIPAPDLDDIEQRKVLGFKGLQGENEICFVLFEQARVERLRQPPLRRRAEVHRLTSRAHGAR
ncbi:MAG TPA: hypothetical protein VGE37_10765 [Archangium sp.]